MGVFHKIIKNSNFQLIYNFSNNRGFIKKKVAE